MKNLCTRFLPLILGASLCAATPALAVNRELVELQTQVQQLQDQITNIKQSLDERRGVM
jgi:cell division protein FtsL